jgi:hypothetical protein
MTCGARPRGSASTNLITRTANALVRACISFGVMKLTIADGRLREKKSFPAVNRQSSIGNAPSFQ